MQLLTCIKYKLYQSPLKKQYPTVTCIKNLGRQGYKETSAGRKRHVVSSLFAVYNNPWFVHLGSKSQWEAYFFWPNAILAPAVVCVFHPKGCVTERNQISGLRWGTPDISLRRPQEICRLIMFGSRRYIPATAARGGELDVDGKRSCRCCRKKSITAE